MEAGSQGKLLQNLVLFGRLLRAIGLDVYPGRMIDLVQALAYVDIGRKSDFYYTARSLLVHKKEDLPLFAQAFELFWRKMSGDGVQLDLSGLASHRRQEAAIIITPPLDESASPPPPGTDDEGELQELIEITRTYSRRELLRHKDFGEMSEEDVRLVKEFIDELIWELGQRCTLRRRPGRGPYLDMRRSLRRSLRYGGEMLEWRLRRPKLKPRPLIIIADISGSMERYSRLLLHFIHGLAKGLTQQVETFVFGTRLTRITRQLRTKDTDKALLQVSQVVHDWAGGTRIGESIKRFNYDWGRRVQAQAALVLLISDGWDRGEPELLQREIARLRRSCHRLVWLNPLLGSPRYEPLTRGMQAALPHIDDFLPVHNLASLEDLAHHLARLTARSRPARRRVTSPGGAAFISG